MKELYVDGSFNVHTGNVGWGFVLLGDGKIVHERCGKFIHPLAKEVRQISGELGSVLYGLEYHFKNYPKEKVEVYYDYTGIYLWICDLFSDGKAWGRKKEIVKIYRKRMEDMLNANSISLVKFTKVKGHSGDYWNDYVDNLAKKGCGVEI